ncbi:alpha/beta hydrolase, partial [Moraxella caviae]
MTVLTFQNITLTPAKVDDQIWLTSAELARALGYAEVDGVTKTYNRKADEFTDSMTALVDNPKMKNAKIRIFSLRGCHLVAMFSRTTVAKEFRKWVLDILDKEVGIQTTAADRTPLRQAISALVGA